MATNEKKRKTKDEVIEEAKISASKSYMKKEALRESVQALISSRVSSGDVKSQQELAELFNDFAMVLKTLEHIPFEVWKQLSK